jgi:hypothetical protein
MSNKTKVFIVNTFHVTVYLVMVSSIFYIIYAAIAKVFGPILIATLTLLSIEIAVFVGSGMRCPITDLSQKYGSEDGYAFERYLSKKTADRIFSFFRVLLIASIILLVIRYLGWF